MRLFVAIPLPPDAQAQVRRFRETAKAAYPDFRWTPPDRLHATLQFLGDADEPTVAAAKRTLGTITGGAPIALRFSATIFLPSARQPRVLALKLAGEVAELQSLRDRTTAAFSRVGIATDDRPFLPHVTVARRDGVGVTVAKSPPVPRAWFTGTSIVLFASHADGSGRRYEPLARVPMIDPLTLRD